MTKTSRSSSKGSAIKFEEKNIGWFWISLHFSSSKLMCHRNSRAMLLIWDLPFVCLFNYVFCGILLSICIWLKISVISVCRKGQDSCCWMQVVFIPSKHGIIIVRRINEWFEWFISGHENQKINDQWSMIGHRVAKHQ